MKASPHADGVDAIQAPGEPEEARRAERGASGVPIDATTWRQIREAAETRLFEMGPAAVPVLEDSLSNKDVEIVYRAERLLLKLGRSVP